MHKIIAGTLFMALAGTLAIAAPPQDRDDHRGRDDRHDNGKHKGEDKHGDDRGDRHDNGNHKGWDNPHNPHHQNWDDDHDRIRLAANIPTGATNMCARILSLAAWIFAPAGSCSTTIPIGSLLPMTWNAAAIGNGNAIVSMCTTTTIIPAGICSLTPAWAATSMSNISACTKKRRAVEVPRVGVSVYL